MEIDQAQPAKETETPAFNPDWTKAVPQLNVLSAKKVESTKVQPECLQPLTLIADQKAESSPITPPEVLCTPGHIAGTSVFLGLNTGQGLGRLKSAAKYGLVGYTVGYGASKVYNAIAGSEVIKNSDQADYIAAGGISAGAVRTGQLTLDRIALNNGYMVQNSRTALISLADDAPTWARQAHKFSPLTEVTNSSLAQAKQLAQADKASKSAKHLDELSAFMHEATDHSDIIKQLKLEARQPSYAKSFIRGIAGGAAVGGGTYFADSQLANLASSQFGADSTLAKTFEPSALGSGLAGAGFALGRSGKSKAIFATAGWLIGKLENYSKK
ncbi:MAG: hypothetical protein K2W82_10540 [Candidatus Obscuribacterales bacterium]|nr:hypothetical protein [Candidatus Obscuribacterales bacterium]